MDSLRTQRTSDPRKNSASGRDNSLASKFAGVVEGYRSFLGRLALLSFTLFLGGCYSSKINEPEPRNREYDEGAYAESDERNKPAVGSLYSEATGSLLEDTRAFRVGDLVVVRINEHADARGGASTRLSRTSSREAGVEELLGLVEAIRAQSPEVDPSTLWKFVSDYQFQGKGDTSRAGSLTGSIGVKVRKMLPNGDLFVEGTKIVMINHEEYHLYVSGVVRTADIQQDNSVDSSLVADSRVEFTGNGDIEEQTQQGWLSWLLNKISPF